MKRRGLWMRALMMAAAVGLLSGCVVVHDGPEEGDLTLYWECDGHNCADAGVYQTYVEVFEGPQLVVSQTVPGDATGVTFEDVEVGHYQVQITGTTPIGRVLYSVVGDVDVFEDHDNQYSFPLYYAP